MDSLADRTIAALRSSHDTMAAAVSDLSPDQLSGPSGAADWTVAQVLSHLGSGAEITLAGFRAAVAGEAPPADGFNQSVWDRWNALAPEDQAAAFVEHDRAVVEALEALTPTQRETVEVDLGFLPAPIPLAAAMGMRLNEVAMHSWDVLVAADAAAEVEARSADVLLEHLSGGLAFLLGFIGKPDLVSEPTRVSLPAAGLALVIEDGVALSEEAASTATFTGDREAALRLLAGRLKPDHTPASVGVTGNITLDELRQVFPGY